jgi:hypothetical protein
VPWSLEGRGIRQRHGWTQGGSNRRVGRVAEALSLAASRSARRRPAIPRDLDNPTWLDLVEGSGDSGGRGRDGPQTSNSREILSRRVYPPPKRDSVVNRYTRYISMAIALSHRSILATTQAPRRGQSHSIVIQYSRL